MLGSSSRYFAFQVRSDSIDISSSTWETAVVAAIAASSSSRSLLEVGSPRWVTDINTTVRWLLIRSFNIARSSAIISPRTRRYLRLSNQNTTP